MQKFQNDGTFITKWGGNGAFINPWGIAIDSSGNVYVADQVHQRIAKFTNNGTFIADWSSQINPTDIAIDSSDNVYVTEMFDSRIAKFHSNGTLITKWNTGPICRGIAVDSSDNIWVTSANNGDTNYLVQKFTSQGTLLDQWTSASTDGVNILGFNGYGIAFDSSGKLFIADTFNNRIQRYETNGTLITQFGILGTGDGELNTPLDLAIDSQDKIFVSDPFNHRIQVFSKLLPIINNPPVAFDKILQININTPVTITLEASDSDMGDFITTFNITSSPIHGQILNFNTANGTLTYTPNNNFVGQDSFTFKAIDNHGLESNNTGLVTINVKALPPPLPINNPPVAVDKRVETNSNTPISIMLEGRDTDQGDSISGFNIVSSPTNGQISKFNFTTRTLTYSPNNNFVGQDSFTFKVTDSHGLQSNNMGLVTINMIPSLEKKIEISSVAKCSPGEFAIGGGFALGGNATIISSKSLPTENGWNATAFVFDTTNGISASSVGSLTANVVCFDNLTLNP